MMLVAAAVAMAVTVWVIGPAGDGTVLHGALTIVANGPNRGEPEFRLWLEPQRLDEAERLLDERIAAQRRDA